MNKAFEKIFEKLDNYNKANDECRKVAIIRNNQHDVEYFQHLMFAIEQAVAIIEETEEEYNNGWIPCSERLPEPTRPVLVTLRNWMNDRYFARVGRFHTDHWRTDEGIIENSAVIAWQPLPEPYQPKGEKPKKTNFDICRESMEAMAQIIDIAKIGWTKEQIMEWLQKEAE